MSDESNPITHSDIGARAGMQTMSLPAQNESSIHTSCSDVVVSTSTGHQVGDGGRHRGYFELRNQKLREQKEQSKSDVLANVRIYINGYLSNTTDIEMKRIVTLAGGRIMFVLFMLVSYINPPNSISFIGLLHLGQRISSLLSN